MHKVYNLVDFCAAVTAINSRTFLSPQKETLYLLAINSDNLPTPR